MLRTLLILWCLAAPTLAQAQAVEPIEFPDTPHGELSRKLLEAFHTGDQEIQAFMEAHRTQDALDDTPMDERLARYREMRAVLGELTPGQFLDHGDEVVILAFASNMQTWMKLTLFMADGKLDNLNIEPSGPPRDEPYFTEWNTLTEMLQQVVESSGVPGIVAAWIQDGEIVDIGFAGVREAGTEDHVAVDDRFHIGSITKSVTATGVAAMVERGQLSWDLTVGEALAAVEMKDAYRTVTLMQLAGHVGGIRPYTNLTAADEERFGGLPGVGGQQRSGFAKYVLMQDPIAEPGSAMNYSNAGYSILGHIAERKARKSWDKVVRDDVFRPLEMTTAMVGWPSGPGKPPAARGHFGSAPSVKVRKDGEYELGDYLDPAGDISMSIGDLARYGQAHLRGLRGEPGLLKPETIQALHALPEGDRTGYAAGWVIDVTDDDQALHWHNGSAGTFFALLQLVPEHNWGVAIMINAAGPADLLDEIANAVYERGLNQP